jgi:hypothetical protein
VTKLAERPTTVPVLEPEDARAPASGAVRWPSVAPQALVAVAVAFNLWYFRSQRLVVAYPNDSQTHLQMVQVARRMLAHGQLPFDHWYANLSLGSPFFVQYQSASAVLTGAVSLLFGAKQTFAWSIYLLVALWPLCVYATGRLLRWSRWESAIAAAISPLLFSVTGRGFEHQAYAWLGSGLWSELWAMWTLPLAIAFAWRYVSGRRYLFGAVFFLGATIAFHFLMAYLAGLLLVAMVLLRPSDLWRRLGRAALVGVCALLATLWVTLPLLADARWTALNEFQVGTTINDSYGAPKILHWLVTGQLYDFQRFPIVTLLVGIGLVACVARFRVDERARLLVVGWTLSLLLYFGRPTLGRVLDLLPGNKDLLFQRFLAGLHLFGLFLAGVGVVALCQLARRGLRAREFDPDRLVGRHWAPAVAGVLAAVALVLVLEPAWTQVRAYDVANARAVTFQQNVDASEGTAVDALLALAAARGGGRVYAGMPSNWGHSTYVGEVQPYIYMEDSSVQGFGFTLRGFGLMTDPEAWFDEYNPGDYAVMGIHYLLLPASKAPPVHATLLSALGGYRLWTVGEGGPVAVVDTTTPLAANASDLGKATKYFLAGSLPDTNAYPTIAYDGQPAATPTLGPGQHASGPAGRVVAVHDDLANGRAAATVDANRAAVVLLKASFDPGWSATVDGEPVRPVMVAPALVGVTVSAGVHRVAFAYHGYGSYPMLFVIALLTLLGVAICPVLWRRYGDRVRAGAKRLVTRA